MRSFLIAALVAVLLAIGFSVVLNFVQQTTYDEFETEGVRL